MREYKMKRLFHLAVALAALVLVTTPARADSDFYTENEILNAARGFFGETTGGLAKAVQKVFSDLGEPNGYILGEEVGGANVGYLHYGKEHSWIPFYFGVRDLPP